MNPELSSRVSQQRQWSNNKYLVIQVNQQRPHRWRADFQLRAERSVVELRLILDVLQELTDISIHA